MNDVISILEQLIQQAADLADELSEEEMQMVMQVFSEAIRVIQESQQAEEPITGGAPPQAPEVPAAEYPSSNVNGFKYDPKSQQLLIQYHGPYPKAAGPVYSYAGVPEYIFKILERGAVGPRTSGKNRYHTWVKGVTPSHGAAVNALIKAGGFQYRKVA